MQHEAAERERFARSKKGKEPEESPRSNKQLLQQQAPPQAAETAAVATAGAALISPASSPITSSPMTRVPRGEASLRGSAAAGPTTTVSQLAAPSLSEVEDRGLVSSTVDADDERSPGEEDTAGSTTDNTVSTAAATTTTTGGSGGEPVDVVMTTSARSEDAGDMAAGVGYDADREGTGGEDQRRQKMQQLRGTAVGGDFADYDGDGESVGGGTNGSRQATVAAGTAAAAGGGGGGEAGGGSAIPSSHSGSGRPSIVGIKPSIVMELIREKEEATRSAAKNPAGQQRSESVATLSPSFAAVRRRKEVDTRVWSGAGTPKVNASATRDGDGDSYTSGGAEAGAESEGTRQREPWASRAPVAVSRDTPLSPSIAAARMRYAREAAGGDTSDASSISATADAPAATSRGAFLSAADATHSAPGGSTQTSMWAPSPSLKARKNGDCSTTPPSACLTPTAASNGASSRAPSASVLARIGSFETGHGAGSVQTSSTAASSSSAGAAGFAAPMVRSPSRPSVLSRVGSLQKAATEGAAVATAAPSSSTASTTSERGGGGSSSSVVARIGSFEKGGAAFAGGSGSGSSMGGNSGGSRQKLSSTGGGGSVVGRIGGFEKDASASTTNAKKTGAVGGGNGGKVGLNTGTSLMDRIGSFEAEARKNRSGSSGGPADFGSESGTRGGRHPVKVGSGLVQALAAKVNGEIGGEDPEAEPAPVRPARGQIGDPFDEEEVSFFFWYAVILRHIPSSLEQQHGIHR